MGVAKRRRGRPPGSTSRSTREGIIRAARTAFALDGYGLATNRDIAEAAGVTAAAIYQYFDSKLALYSEVAHETITTVTAHMRGAAGREAGAVAALAAMVRALLSLHEQDPSLAAFMAALPAELRRHPELAKAIDLANTDLGAIMGALVGHGVEAGEIDPSDAGASAEMFIACMMGLSQYAALVGDGRSPALAFARLLEGALFSHPNGG